MDWLRNLTRARDPTKTYNKTLVVSGPDNQVTGKKTELKESQSYPVAFGLAVGREHTQWRTTGAVRPP